MKREDWEAEATHWIAWAREPEHDAYYDYGPIFFEQMVPPPGRRTLDLGCGEGRLTRELRRRGHEVVGVDGSPTLVAAARATARARSPLPMRLLCRSQTTPSTLSLPTTSSWTSMIYQRHSRR